MNNYFKSNLYCNKIFAHIIAYSTLLSSLFCKELFTKHPWCHFFSFIWPVKKLHLLDEYIVWWHLSEEHWAKKTRPRIKTTKYSVFNNFQNLREHNPYTTLEPSFECSFSTPTSQDLCLNYQIRVTFNTWKQTLAHFHIQAVFWKITKMQVQKWS